MNRPSRSDLTNHVIHVGDGDGHGFRLIHHRRKNRRMPTFHPTNRRNPTNRRIRSIPEILVGLLQRPLSTWQQRRRRQSTSRRSDNPT